jgi:hypothetical protein
MKHAGGYPASNLNGVLPTEKQLRDYQRGQRVADKGAYNRQGHVSSGKTGNSFVCTGHDEGAHCG